MWMHVKASCVHESVGQRFCICQSFRMWKRKQVRSPLATCSESRLCTMLLHVDGLAALIDRVLREKDWTLSTLARRSELSVSTLHSWKSGDRATGNRGPNPEKLRQLASGAGLTVAEVFEAAGRHVPAAID